MTHQQLCERALRWLSGSRRCEPVFCGIASCSEIPDAIGWSSAWQWRGSTVVECKTSVSDFRADQKKRFGWKHIDSEEVAYRGARITPGQAAAHGYERVAVPAMGNYRFFMSLPNVVTLALVEEHAPDHGLLHIEGRSVRVVRAAPRRELVHRDAEIRYLRFAIINSKSPYGAPGGVKP